MAFHSNYPTTMDSKSKYTLSGYRLGSPTSPMTAKQLSEFSARLNEGVQNVEVGTIDPNLLDTVPTEHLDAIRKLSELTNSNVSLHAPIIDPAGFDDKGNWSEHQRRVNQEQITSVLEKANKLSKNGNIPVVLHSTAGAFAQQFDSELNNKMKWKDYDKSTDQKTEYERNEDGTIKYRPGIRALGVIDQTEGRIGVAEYEKKYTPGVFKGEKYKIGAEQDIEEIWTPWDKLNSMNRSKWDQEKLKLLSYQNEIDKLMEKAQKIQEQNASIKNSGLLKYEEAPHYGQQYEQNKQNVSLIHEHIHELETHIGSGYRELHAQLVKYAPKKGTKVYKEYEEKFPKYQEDIRDLNLKIQKAVKIVNDESKSEEERLKAQGVYALAQDQKKKKMLTTLSEMPTPQIFKPVGEFAIEKTAETVGNAMFEYYNRNKNNPGFELDKMPILAMENVFPTSPLSTAEELKKGIHESRKIFAEKLQKEGKFSSQKAKEAAEKLIGATWDVGHINQLRKAGYTEAELKDLVIEETKKIAPDVKHLHLTDNFGFGDTHLPPGMGNVPIKEMAEELEKRGFTGRAIVEAGNFVKEFGTSPTHEVLEYFESPMFKEDDPMYRLGPGPYWQTEQFPQYRTSYIEFPQQHFNLYGSSFTTLPKELGGEMGRGRDRFTGTPNA